MQIIFAKVEKLLGVTLNICLEINPQLNISFLTANIKCQRTSLMKTCKLDFLISFYLFCLNNNNNNNKINNNNNNNNKRRPTFLHSWKNPVEYKVICIDFKKQKKKKKKHDKKR